MRPGEAAGEMTVGKAAAMLGVTVRTLHHWDAMGLVRPSERSAVGYRIYTAEDLLRLQRVLIYRELDLPLDEIGRLLEAGSEGAESSLRQQRDRIAERMERLEQMSGALEKLIAAHERGVVLTSEEQLAVFGEDWDPDWSRQARQRWGNSAQWAQYAERSAQRDAEQWAGLVNRTEQFESELVEAFQEPIAVGDEAANALAERHRMLMSEHFDCTHSMQACIARNYAAGGELNEHYERLATGLGDWLKEIIDANARAAGIDPETAQWE